MPFVVGETIGSYRILEQLGQGGMATVFKAYHAALDRYVAIKVLHPAFTEDPNFLARFQREARVVAKLEHPNIVPIYDFAQHEGRPFLVMKYIEGETLKARLARGPLGVDETLRVVEAVGKALAYAHQGDILHRDVKPSNVILARDGQIYLADFGLARIASAGESTLSSDMMVGTPQYISPEQALGRRDLNAGTDIYSFGVLLYELAVGRVPFSADTPYAIIHDHIYSPLPRPRTMNPAVSEEVERVLLKALAKERADRHPSASALVEAFEKAYRGTAAQPAVEAVSQPVPPAPPEPTVAEARVVSPEPAPAPVAILPVPVVAETTAAPPATPIPASFVAETTVTPPTQAGPAGAMPLPVPGTLVAPVSTPLPPAAEALPITVKKPRSKKWMQWLLIPVVVACLCLVGRVGVGAIQKARQTAESKKAGEKQVTPTLGKVVVGNEEINNARQRVDENPNDPYIRLELAVALYRDGQSVQAEQTYRDAMGLAVQDAQFFAKAGEKWASLGNWGWAVFAYQLMVKTMPQPLPPDLVDRWHEAVYRAYKDPKTPTLVPFTSIEEVDPIMAGIARARNALATEQLDLAEEAINAIFRVKPDFPEARLVMAEFLLRRGKIEQARQVLEELKIDSQLPGWIRDVAKQIFEEKILTKP